VEELESIETREVYIVDDTFLLDRSRLLEIADAIRRRGIKKEFLVYGRSDFIANNEDVIKEWSEIGLKAVILGLEFTSDHELDSVNTSKLRWMKMIGRSMCSSAIALMSMPPSFSVWITGLKNSAG
jgi:radical SAM superfamily enzyme YgiQ (UPF0313 family)